MDTKTVWELLWDYDPNSLVVVDTTGRITLANPAFCEMVQLAEAEVVGRPVAELLDDAADFEMVWRENRILRGKEVEYRRYGRYVNKVMFPIPDQRIIACILVDLTHEWRQKQELRRLRQETLLNVGQVVDKQMQVAQEIAGLLGETTAETKVNLLKLVGMLKEEDGVVREP